MKKLIYIICTVMLLSSCTKYEQIVLPYYDTTFVVITDTNQFVDTTRVIINDTNYIIVIIYDTISTLKIGNQLWMKGDLQTLFYNDGTPIKIAENNEAWIEATPHCCHFNNDPNSYILYNWYAIATGKLCPIGFHVPTEADWVELEEYLGDPSTRGAKLKETGYVHWRPNLAEPTAVGTDDFGWTAIPKLLRWGHGEFGYDGPFGVQSVVWWSSSIDPESNLPIYRQVQYNMGSLVKYRHYPSMGFSVRCLKNK